MTITITLETGNAAFEDSREVPRILRDWLKADYPHNATLRDSNGNTVGKVTVTGK